MRRPLSFGEGHGRSFLDFDVLPASASISIVKTPPNDSARNESACRSGSRGQGAAIAPVREMENPNENIDSPGSVLVRAFFRRFDGPKAMIDEASTPRPRRSWRGDASTVIRGRRSQEEARPLPARFADGRRRESGPVIVPGKPDESPLWEQVESGEMPPKSPLPTPIRPTGRWIAPIPRTGGPTRST